MTSSFVHPRSPYLTVVSTPSGQTPSKEITITTLSVNTGKIVHSFKKPFASFTLQTSIRFAVVP